MNLPLPYTGPHAPERRTGITDELLGLLPSQYDEADYFRAVIGAIGDAYQADADYDYVIARQMLFFSAEEVWLDHWARAFGYQRNVGEKDDVLRARIMVDRHIALSSGTIPELIDIVNLLLPSASVRQVQTGGGWVVLYVYPDTNGWSPAVVETAWDVNARMQSIMNDAVQAGFEWQVVFAPMINRTSIDAEQWADVDGELAFGTEPAAGQTDAGIGTLAGGSDEGLLGHLLGFPIRS